jgi:hypothetical protein
MVNKREVIDPEDRSEVLYWTKKWGVSRRQIYDAILETGSIELNAIKRRLRKKGDLHFFPNWLYKIGRVF